MKYQGSIRSSAPRIPTRNSKIQTEAEDDDVCIIHKDIIDSTVNVQDFVSPRIRAANNKAPSAAAFNNETEMIDEAPAIDEMELETSPDNAGRLQTRRGPQQGAHKLRLQQRLSPATITNPKSSEQPVGMDISPYPPQTHRPDNGILMLNSQNLVASLAATHYNDDVDEVRTIKFLRSRLLSNPRQSAATTPQPEGIAGRPPGTSAVKGGRSISKLGADSGAGMLDCYESSDRREIPLRPSLQKTHDELVAMMDRVVGEEGSTASVLLLGERGAGKTLVIERALRTLCSKHNNRSSSIHSPSGTSPLTSPAAASQAVCSGTSTAAAAAGGDKMVGVVRLSGLLHLDERAAFQEIARQLCVEFQQLFAKSATYDENLTFLRTMLQALYRCLKSVVFVLDELDVFTKKGKQVLLYNLLDTLAHSKVQACVVGVSCMVDVMDHMEKRVKSRFSHRRILITTPSHFEATESSPPSAVSSLSPGSAVTSSRKAGSSPNAMRDNSSCEPHNVAPGNTSSDQQTTPTASVLFMDTPLGMMQAMLLLPSAPAALLDRSAAAALLDRSAAAYQQSVTEVATASAPRLDSRIVHNGHHNPACTSSSAVVGLVTSQRCPSQQLRLNPGYVEQYNQAVLVALSDSKFKAALLTVFQERLRPSDLVNIMHCFLCEWMKLINNVSPPSSEPSPGSTSSSGLGKTITHPGQQQWTLPNAGLLIKALVQHSSVHTSQRDMLMGLSVLQLFLVVSLYRLLAKGQEVVNFEMVYDEYRSLQGGLSATDQQYKWSKETALRAFQGLALCGLVGHVGGGCGRLAGRGAAYAAVELRLGRSTLDAALKEMGQDCPDLLLRFFKMEV
ncbi:hypothetical protein CEUSTIGMA_g11023.t1 [Chlamydomonas eustigma]|uniref:Origin recognition complex subunit 4 C-terminal domain-containing protein n=1 Tax=Chlamydomonas eustigma TaxID=1157962 RepID=A0A250XKJ9_9CHLO|nr:hypothetical protein CEUSTIGMA_g11023.t1 [Chlamydomonas eustigma]|eukprot:GAX83598.1 hypothetical protein CEUSTIGMA_g11023.t1 [Chlamydomonas eustigma]